MYKGLFFYKTTEEKYEIDILKIFNKLLDSPSSTNNKYPIWFNKKLPFRYNVLLCYDDCPETEIASFCLKAINW